MSDDNGKEKAIDPVEFFTVLADVPDEHFAQMNVAQVLQSLIAWCRLLSKSAALAHQVANQLEAIPNLGSVEAALDEVRERLEELERIMRVTPHLGDPTTIIPDPRGLS